MIKIKHVSEYIKYLEDDTARYINKQPIIFRGEPRVDYKLIPSLYRERTEYGVTANVYMEAEKEKDIIQEFVTEAAGYINQLDIEDSFRWIQYAQHFGTPTRLLDWTSNPLVALYFACSSNDTQDGKVHILQSNYYKQITSEQINTILHNKTINEATSNMIWEGEEGYPYPVVFKPYYFDKRMSAQSSCFMVWGNQRRPLDMIVYDLEQKKKGRALVKKEETAGVKRVYEEEGVTLKSLLVCSDSKKRILHELDVININQATLFPGLDGIGRSIEWRNNYFNRVDIYP